MSARNTYTRPMSGWYTKNPYFIAYMVREGTAIFLAIYAIVLLSGLSALARGAESYDRWLGFLASPFSILLHLLILAAALYHTYTWFKVSPRTMPPINIGKQKLSDSAIIAGQYAAAIVLSLAILIIAW
jgi:fumarate reductase subunit C